MVSPQYYFQFFVEKSFVPPTLITFTLLGKHVIYWISRDLLHMKGGYYMAILNLFGLFVFVQTERASYHRILC